MRTSRLIAMSVSAVLLSAGLAACGSEDEPTTDAADSSSDESDFPVTIEHALGTTTIPEKPERIATVAWANHEVPLALGVVPVGMSKATWGDDDDNGILPWVEDQLAELDAEDPVLFDETDGIPFEAVSDTQPDVILAAYSGLTEEEYETLSDIAPVVAYPEVAWGTSYQDMIRLSSQAMGMAEEGDQLITDLETEVSDALETHSEIKDQRFLFSYVDAQDLSKVGFYTSHDTRPGFLAEAGLPLPEIVEEETAKTDKFYVEVSAEEAERFDDVDVFVGYGEPDGKLIKQLQADPLLSKIPAIANGSIVILENDTPLAASANPSPLSIGWGIEEYFALLATGVKPSE